MAESASAERRRLMGALLLLTLGAAGVLAIGTGPVLSTIPAAGSTTEHGTRPEPLGAVAVQQVARAFGISGKVHRTPTGWEAEDTVRALYINRTPSAWYAMFTNSAVLLHPLADRSVICSRSDRPPGCRDATVPFAIDVGAKPPTAAEAVRSVRVLLTHAKLVDSRWTVVVLPPGPDVVPCREGVHTSLDCTQQYVPTRAVMLTLDLGKGTTALRWGLVVGPGGEVLTATGRFGQRS